MTIDEFFKTDWHRGNEVRLTNGKEYFVKGKKGYGRYLLLYSAEYDANFIADHNIVECRTSDYIEPEEVYLEKKRQKQAEAEAQREAERQERLRAKEERKRRNLEEQERIHQEALARKAAKRALMEEEQKAKAKAKKYKKIARLNLSQNQSLLQNLWLRQSQWHLLNQLQRQQVNSQSVSVSVSVSLA